MDQLLGITGLIVLAAAVCFSFWRKYKKKSLRPVTPAGSIPGCDSQPGTHCGQCPLGRVNDNSK